MRGTVQAVGGEVVTPRPCIKPRLIVARTNRPKAHQPAEDLRSLVDKRQVSKAWPLCLLPLADQ